MYWFTNLKKQSTLAIGLLIMASVVSCQTGNKTERGIAEYKVRFIDLPSFFQQEIDRLKQENPEINKTVAKDGEEETKKLSIKNWEAELASFKSLDLNKSAYADYIQVDSSAQTISYHIDNPKADLSCVRIELDSTGQPKSVSAQRNIKNTLYHTSEFLMYEKGKFYLVEKDQDVRAMGENHYKVLGRF